MNFSITTKILTVILFVAPFLFTDICGTPTNEPPFKFAKLVLSWLHSACRQFGTECQETSWVVHSMLDARRAPYKQQVSEEYEIKKFPFPVREIMSNGKLYADLTKNWISVDRCRTNIEFLAYQWYKHGKITYEDYVIL